MKTILFILISFNLLGHRPPEPSRFITKYNVECHFYGSILVNDATYSIQGLVWKDWTPTNRLIISNIVTLGAITLKEVFDIHKTNPTGFSKDDFFTGLWAMPIYIMVRICINDFRKVGLIPRKKKNKYSLSKDY